jgi:hypothetical protein
LTYFSRDNVSLRTSFFIPGPAKPLSWYFMVSSLSQRYQIGSISRPQSVIFTFCVYTALQPSAALLRAVKRIIIVLFSISQIVIVQSIMFIMQYFSSFLQEQFNSYVKLQ